VAAIVDSPLNLRHQRQSVNSRDGTRFKLLTTHQLVFASTSSTLIVVYTLFPIADQALRSAPAVMSASVPMLDLPGSRSSSHMGAHSASIPKMPGSMMSHSNSDEDDDTPTFDSPQEEAAHYREKYRRILDTLDETRAELGELVEVFNRDDRSCHSAERLCGFMRFGLIVDEFQQSSRELEEELEKDLQATEKEKLELKEKIVRLEIEKDEWKVSRQAQQACNSPLTCRPNMLPCRSCTARRPVRCR